MEYHLLKISLNRGSSYIKSPEWIINKYGTINTENNRFLQYAITVALHHKNISHHPERIANISPFIDNYNWKDIEFSSYSKDWKKFEQNNKTIALNILSVPCNTKQIIHTYAYISKYNSKRDNFQVVFLMITDGEKWHYLAVKSVTRFIRGITSHQDGDFYCLNCFHSYTTKKRLKKHERICRDHDFCYLKMPDENNKFLKYLLGEKSLKHPFIIYADLECLLEKIDTCHNNPEKSYTEKKAKHKPLGYSLVTYCSFDKTKTTWNYYRGKDYMKTFCNDLRDRAMKIINYEKKKEIMLTNEEK